jgi:hypothetical protein
MVCFSLNGSAALKKVPSAPVSYFLGKGVTNDDQGDAFPYRFVRYVEGMVPMVLKCICSKASARPKTLSRALSFKSIFDGFVTLSVSCF